jgi:peptidoglycan/LPS O-acetylase OafA/YrhL
LGNDAGGLLLLAVAVLTAAGIWRCSAFYRRELAEYDNRELPLDGLRGMAALAVVIHHAGIFFGMQFFAQRWGYAGSPVLQLLGPAGVMIFFMLTGYLFWSKARAVNGKMNAWKLWRGRLNRIAPLYLFSLVLVLLIAVVQTGGNFLTWENRMPLLRLLALGAFQWQPLGRFNIFYINGVVWTLWWEWRFYLALPFIAWFSVGRRTFWFILLVCAVAFAGMWFNLILDLWLVFILGMFCAVLLDDQRLRSHLRCPAAAGVALSITLLLCISNSNYQPSLTMAGALFPLFLTAAAGNDFFGFLTQPAIRCLGAISYSLYMLHCVVFYLAITALKAVGLTMSQSWYWLFIAAVAAVLILICAATYRWIEFPFLSGRRISQRLQTDSPEV